MPISLTSNNANTPLQHKRPKEGPRRNHTSQAEWPAEQLAWATLTPGCGCSVTLLNGRRCLASFTEPTAVPTYTQAKHLQLASSRGCSLSCGSSGGAATPPNTG